MNSKSEIRPTSSKITKRKKFNRILFYASILFSISIFIGCGNNSSKKFKIKANEGNSLELDENFKVEIPNGSLNQNYSCELSKSNGKKLPVTSGFSVYGDVYNIQHDGIVLNKKADVKIKLDTAYIEGKYQIARYHEKSIEILETSFKDGYLKAQTSAFSSFFIYSKSDFNFGEKDVDYGENSEINQNQKFYLAKVKKSQPINIYKSSFNFMETKIIGSIKPSENFKAYVGMGNGKVRKIITNGGIIGFVESSKIEIEENHDSFKNTRKIADFEILPENILLERLKKDKLSFKNSINSNYLIEYKTAVRNNKNFILIELTAKNPDYSIETHRGGFGLTLSNKLNIDQSKVEVNYYNKKGHYIDAIELSTKYEDYYYDIIKEISGAITGKAMNFDKVKSFLEYAGVGEIETPVNEDFLKSSSSNNQFIGKYFGSYQHANSYLYPKANSVQIAIPVDNSFESIGQILIDDEIKLLLGTYLSDGVGRCTIIKKIKKVLPICDANSFEGTFSNDKALNFIYPDLKGSENNFKWMKSKFVKKNIVENFADNNGFYNSKINKVLDVDNQTKILITTTERVSDSYRRSGNIYSIFLFIKCQKGWQVSNYMSQDFYNPEFNFIKLGDQITGLNIKLNDDAQGYVYVSSNIYMPYSTSFKEVLSETTKSNNSGAATSNSERWSFVSEISSQSSDKDLYDIIIHKKGSMRDDNYEIININENNIYKFDGEKYVLSNLEKEKVTSKNSNRSSPDQVVIDYYKWEQNDLNNGVKLIDENPPKLIKIDNYLASLKRTGWFSKNYLNNLKKFYGRCNESLKKGQLQSFEFIDLSNIYFTQEGLSGLIVQDPVINKNKAKVILKQCYPSSLKCDFKTNPREYYIGKDCECLSYGRDITVILVKENNKWVIDNLNNITNQLKSANSASNSNSSNNYKSDEELVKAVENGEIKTLFRATSPDKKWSIHVTEDVLFYSNKSDKSKQIYFLNKKFNKNIQSQLSQQGHQFIIKDSKGAEIYVSLIETPTSGHNSDDYDSNYPYALVIRGFKDGYDYYAGGDFISND